jgi:hypothetical protein
MARPLRISGVFVKIATLVILALGLDTNLARPQPYSFAEGERDFRVEWDQHPTGLGPAIGGYVYNNAGMPAARVRVLVEGLDGAGRPINTTIGYVVGTVPGFSRTPFEVRVPGAASYRVSVLSFEWLKGAGGGGGM